MSEEGVESDPEKHQLLSRTSNVFLGFAGFYRRYVQDFAKIAKPLHLLTDIVEGQKWKKKSSALVMGKSSPGSI